MKREQLLSCTAVALLAVIGSLTWKVTSRAGYESATYKVIESDGEYEVREYPDLMLASTTTNIDAQGRDGSFMKLFSYISGANKSEQKISMTTPVFMESRPLANDDKAEPEVQMGFVMPRQVAADGVPAPKGEDVAIRTRKGGRFAVIRFSGRLNTDRAKQSEAKLRAWMKAKGLVAEYIPEGDSPGSSGVESAAYDPPFTPDSMRRNEILIRLQ